MRPVLPLAALAAVLVAALGGCSDEDPFRFTEGDHARVMLRPQLNSFGASPMLPINLIRLSVEEQPGGALLLEVDTTVSPTEATWNVSLQVPLVGGQPTDVIVVIELINVTDGLETVEWSGQVGPLSLEAGESGSAPVVDLFRGSRDNLSITAVTIAGSESVIEGATLRLTASATGATGVPQLFWSSLDPAVAGLDTAAGDSAIFLGLLPGPARIVVEAGPRADTLLVNVLARVTSIEVSPVQDTLDALGSAALFTAAALDARGDTVPDVPFDWTSSDSLIARSVGGGAFDAIATGSITVTAATAAAPGVTSTAQLTIRQVVDSVDVTAPADTLADGATMVASATAFDANGNPIVGAAFTWTSSNAAIASVDASGLVSAIALGDAWIRAASGAAADSVAVTVVAGAVDSVDVQPENLAFATLGTTASLTASGFDASGNPAGGAASWLSRDEAVGTVDAQGVVTATGSGATWIVATIESVSDSALVEVTAGRATWNGTTSADWFDAANWNGGVTPAPTDTVIVPASATFQPVLTAPDSIGGVIVEDGALLTIDTTTLTVTRYVQAGNTIAGTGTLRARDALVSGTLPNLEVVGVTEVTGVTTIVGDVSMGEPFAELHITSPTSITGSAVIAGDGVFLYVGDSLDVAGSLQLGGAEIEVVAGMEVVGTVVVGDSLFTTGRGRPLMQLPGARIRVLGNARFSSIQSTDGFTMAGTIELAGDWFSELAAFHSPDIQLILSGTAGPQSITHLNAGHDPGEGHFGPVQVTNPDGVVFLTRSLVRGDLTSDAGVPIVADTLLVEGALIAGGNFSSPDLSAYGMSVAGTFAVDVASYIDDGATPVAVNAALPYAALRIAADGAAFDGPASITGQLVIGPAIIDDRVFGTGTVLLGGRTTAGEVIVQGGALDLGGQTLDVAGPFSTTSGGTLSMVTVADSLIVGGDAIFAGGSTDGLLTGGVVDVRSPGNFITQGAAFRSTGTALHMRGDTLSMSNAGPAAGQGRLGDLVLETSFLVLDSAYVGGRVTDAAPSGVVDMGQIESGAWRGLLRVEGDILTPQTGYTFLKLMLGDSLDIDTGASDVDSIQFTGNGQIAPSVVPGTFTPFPYSNLIVTGQSVDIGTASDFLDIAGDIFVRGPGATATLRSNDGANIGSLTIEQGDALTGVVLQTSVVASDSIVIESGALDPNGFPLTVNQNGLAVTALRTLGSGAIVLDQTTDALEILSGNVVFEGGNLGVLSAGTLTVPAGGNFESTGDAFRSTGTRLVMRGDTIRMANSGPGAGQGQLADLGVASSSLTVLDSLYVTGSLDDIDPFGSFITGAAGTERVQALGPALLDSTSITLNHLVLGDSLAVGAFGGFSVDTTEFVGTGQVAPVVRTSGFTPMPYATLLITGDSVDLGTASDNLSLSTVPVVVRGAATTVMIYTSDNGSIGSLSMEAGDASQRVRLVGPVDVFDSVRVATGVLDLNNSTLNVNVNGVAPVAFRTTGTGAIEMNQPLDQLVVADGDVFFEGGGTNGMLTSGALVLRSDAGTTSFHATGNAFHSTGTYARLDVDSIVVVGGGTGPTDARFAALEFGTQTGPFFTQQLVGDLVVADSLVDYIGAGSGITGAPGSSLTVLGRWATSIARFDLPRLVAFDTLRAGESSYNVAVTELAGAGQIVPEFQNLPFDTLLVTGDVTFQVDTMSADTLARFIQVDGGSLTLQGSGGLIEDSLVVEGAGAFFDNAGNSVTIGDLGTLSGALITRLGGELRMGTGTGFVTVNGPVEFTGGSTDGLLTAGTLLVRGDFYAENGAFQASGTHRTMFNSFGVLSPPFITLNLPTGGATVGSDHFNDLALEWNSTVSVASDLYVLGDLTDNSDASSEVVGNGETIFSDGWLLNNGLTVSDVTLNVDQDLNPGRTGSLLIDGVGFGAYNVAVPRMVVRHPGDFDQFNFGFLDIVASPDGGSYLEAIDADGASPFLTINVTFRGAGEPADWASRTTESGGAVIFP